MRKYHSTIDWTAMVALLMLCGTSASAEPADWRIDPEHFSIAFEAKHAGYQQQLGFFLDASGSFRYDAETRELTSGRIEIQAQSIFSNHERRDDHLRSNDFLNVRRHPVIVFEATGYTPSGAGVPSESGESGESGERGVLTGDLTLLGNTHPVELDVTINKQARYPFGHRRETLGISAHTTILRSLWGMDYGVADDLVGDGVTLRFEFEALQQ